MATRWFEYEHLTDELATLAFAGQWVRVLAATLKRCGMDCREDEKGDPVPLPFPYQGSTVEYFKEFKDGEDWHNFERLRAICDRELIPYSLFCDVAASVLLGTDGFPFEIASVRELLVLPSVMEEVRQRISTGPIVRSRQPFFKPENYTGHRTQVAYFLYLLQAINKKYGERSSGVLSEWIRNGVMIGFDNLQKVIDIK